MRTRFLVIALCVVGAIGAVFAPGCSDQAQGERCDRRNGDSDCAAGLFCQQINAPAAQPWNYRCCPQDLSQATASECIRGTNPSNPAPPDGSTDTGSTADTGSDAQLDAPVDSGTDAADAADSGG